MASQSVAPERFRVIIIGGGIGGCSLAHGLKKHSIDVVVYERDVDKLGPNAQYRVGVSPSGATALKRLLPEDLFQVFVETACQPILYFKFIKGENLKDVIMGIEMTADRDKPDHEREHGVSRHHLRQVLITGFDSNELRLGRKYTHYTVDDSPHHPNGPPLITAHFEDGSSDTGHLLIAADGTKSRVRQQYLPHAVNRESGVFCIAGKLPISEKIRSMLPAQGDRGVLMLQMLDRFEGSFFTLEFNKPDLEDPETASRYTDQQKDVFRRCGESLDGWHHWGLWAEADQFPPTIRSMTGEQIHEVALKLAQRPDWSPAIAEYVKLSTPDATSCIVVKTSEPMAPWKPSPSITLIGDAVHAMTPGRGAGANTALRDSDLLAAILHHTAQSARDQGRQVPTRDELTRTIASYEEQMRGYAYPAVLSSRSFMSTDTWVHKYGNSLGLGWLFIRGHRLRLQLVQLIPARIREFFVQRWRRHGKGTRSDLRAMSKAVQQWERKRTLPRLNQSTFNPRC